MKYPGGNASTLFCEQVGTVTSLFEQWTECERTVVLYALLKRVPFGNLKFLQLSIELNLTQNYNTQPKLLTLETNSNSAVFLTKLIQAYKNFNSNDTQLIVAATTRVGPTESSTHASNSTISTAYESDSDSAKISINNNNNLNNHNHNNNNNNNNTNSNRKYNRKEDILNDLLTHLPLLKPNSDKAKAIYMDFVPLAVEDSVRHAVNTELVQQILSYMLIHPAITNEDRRSLSQWLRHLEDHISSTYIMSANKPNYFVGLAADMPANLKNNSCNAWQTITSLSGPSETRLADSTWDLNSLQVSQEFGDPVHSGNKEFRKTVAKPSSAVSHKKTPTKTSSGPLIYASETVSDDHHVSFSKNGTEIADFDPDDYNKSNTQIAFDPLANYIAGTGPAGHCDTQLLIADDCGTLKTRRSNSLTMAITQTITSSSSSSAENLTGLVPQKPRSFSLSMESARHSSLTSSGSETRLDDFATTHNMGMTSIGQWLKSLRLHKYVWLFSNITYDQMMGISEEYLQKLGVTKGARHKLVLCIQKLRERFAMLVQMEKDLLTGVVSIGTAAEELTQIVLTPMRPADLYCPDDVAGQLFKIVDLVSTIIVSKPIVSAHNEEATLNVLVWILDRMLHGDAFLGQTNHLRELKFQLSKLKMQFGQRGHFIKSMTTPNAGLIKNRWNLNTKTHKTGQLEKIHQRKNSTNSIQPYVAMPAPNVPLPVCAMAQAQSQAQPLYHSTDRPSHFFAKAPSQQHPLQPQSQPQAQPQPQHHTHTHTLHLNHNSNAHSLAPSYNKSSSYPDFDGNPKSNKIGLELHSSSSSSSSSASSSNEQKPLAAATFFHRHSLHSLSSGASDTTAATLVSPSLSSISSSATTTNSISSNEKSTLSCSGVTATVKASAKPKATATVTTTASAPTVAVTVAAATAAASATTTTAPAIDSHKPSIDDISSRLEFLCLQMTEQAIN